MKKTVNISSFSLFLVSFLFFFSPSPALAATYYVDQNHPQASDSNAGTEEAPWKSVIYGATQLQAGDTMLVKNGTYGTKDKSTWEEPGIAITHSGTETNPITIKAYPGHTPVITGIDNLGNPVPQFTFGAWKQKWIIIDGLTFYKASVFFRGEDHVNKDCSHIVIQNSKMDYGLKYMDDPSYTPMIQLDSCSNVTIKNNSFSNNKFWGVSGTNAAAIILHWDDDVLIEDNSFYDNVIAYRNKAGSGGKYGKNNIFRKNIVKSSTFAGVYMGGYSGASTYNIIENNIFINNDDGINIDTGNISLIIRNNVFYLNPGFSSQGDPPAGIAYSGVENYSHEVFNNIFLNYPSPVSNYSAFPSPYYIDYNLYTNFAGFQDQWNWITYEQFKSNAGGNIYSIVNKDPQFMNAPTDFHLQSTSPCIESGKDSQDMGAYSGGSDTTFDLVSPLPPSNLIVQ